MTKEHDIEQINKVFYPFNLSVSEVVEGLRINQYKVKLPLEGNLNKYLKLEKNLMAALNDNSIKVFQEGAYLVIEKKLEIGHFLNMNDCFASSMYGSNNDFPLVIGQDIYGKNAITKLVKAPHILVSGCTGSGKTQLLHCFIASILLGGQTSHLILIDPKGDEFNIYQDVPTVEFIPDVNRALSTLECLVTEMNARYEEKARLGINDFNESRFTRIICIIDEFADLIKTNPQIEKSVVLLAQKSRAAGIHLIIGTQYPKVDVITGLIKANIPTRVCLKVNSTTESRVAIDFSGGEKLFGHGDLLFKGNTSYEPIHLQAPFMSRLDKQRVIDYAKNKFANVSMKPFNNQSSTPTPEHIDWSKVDMHGQVQYDRMTDTYVYPLKEEPKPSKKKRLGLFGTIRALWNASPYFYIEEEDR